MRTLLCACTPYEIYVREQWACIQKVITVDSKFENTFIHCDSAVERRKERKVELSRVDGSCPRQSSLLTELSTFSVAVESI